eukprot:TRINITY_DN10773_c0_g1_i1.p1 TRINITY_DN10773_c0_g1~~TRINITY_DN10773_c0_g1_i1.p1  ORF type:complete len:321 (-),score=37.47 TRINITY_DN10773_c0_g1_i1:120-998(-)
MATSARARLAFAVACTSAGVAGAAVAAPCDIYDESGTPCVAAYSTVRALYDQSPKANHLSIAPPGGIAKHTDKGVDAARERLTVSGHTVYGAFFETGMGYRRENTSGVAVGDEPESMYMVVSGRHFDGKCCFDFGNAEADAIDHGEGTMEAVYWGSHKGWGAGGGDGPWIMADLENGLWAGDKKINPNNTNVNADFVTAVLKGRAGGFTLKGGDAQVGSLRLLFDGKRPPKYDPMKKQGAIILGIGGDNSDWAVGTFYEGVMTAGFSSDEADDAVHANIVAAGYGRGNVLVV